MAALLAASTGNAQLVTNTAQIPDTGKPPVIFINGYQGGCTESSFAGTFGIGDQLLQRDGRASVFFNNCSVPGNPAIEELGNGFRDFLNALRFADGRAVTEFDVVAHSMGGDILRSYLTGKQTARGVFQPPAEVRVRKAVFLAVPFFGSIVSDISSPDIQSQQLQIGSPLLFDLATWNQGRDDMRGIDAVAVVATGGTGILNSRLGFDDSTVTLTSGSLEWYAAGRTRVVPNLCHTVLSGFLAVACVNPSTSVARMLDEQHASARIMRSFLGDTNEWTTVGGAPADDRYLKERAGVQVQVRGIQDQILRIEAATPDLKIRGDEVAWTDFAPTATTFPLSITVEGSTARVDGAATIRPGSTQVRVISLGGPQIEAIIPNFSDVSPRAVAPGSFISVYGRQLSISTGTGAPPYPTSLGGAEVLLGGQPIGVQYASATQINAVVPDTAANVMRLQIRTANGISGINLLVEPSVPSLFPTAVNAVTGALVGTSAPLRPGDYISIYATGLGLTDRRADGLDWARIQPGVTVGGQPCSVLFAGRAPGYVGLDQINCQIAPGATVSDTAPVVVRTGRRTASITVPIR
ncbi:MAG: hypothetical protein SGI92_06420 [Bryobacteraceae bacterium]|nr:hypothetical protein [Bryobacteraceae bacterium]